MVRVLELVVGLLLFPWAVWAFLYPWKDFELGKKIGYIGVRNREQLELNSWGVLRNRIGYGTLVLLAVFLVFDSVYTVL
jgi:hypothetical protein